MPARRRSARGRSRACARQPPQGPGRPPPTRPVGTLQNSARVHRSVSGSWLAIMARRSSAVAAAAPSSSLTATPAVARYPRASSASMPACTRIQGRSSVSTTAKSGRWAIQSTSSPSSSGGRRSNPRAVVAPPLSPPDEVVEPARLGQHVEHHSLVVAHQDLCARQAPHQADDPHRVRSAVHHVAQHEDGVLRPGRGELEGAVEGAHVAVRI